MTRQLLLRNGNGYGFLSDQAISTLYLFHKDFIASGHKPFKFTKQFESLAILCTYMQIIISHPFRLLSLFYHFSPILVQISTYRTPTVRTTETSLWPQFLFNRKVSNFIAKFHRHTAHVRARTVGKHALSVEKSNNKKIGKFYISVLPLLLLSCLLGIKFVASKCYASAIFHCHCRTLPPALQHFQLFTLICNLS